MSSELKLTNEPFATPYIPSVDSYSVQRINGGDAYLTILLALAERAASKAEHFLRETMPKYKCYNTGNIKRFFKMVYNPDAKNYFDKGALYMFRKKRNEQMEDVDFDILSDWCYGIEENIKTEEKQLIYAITKEMKSKNVKHLEFFLEFNLVLCNLHFFKYVTMNVRKVRKYAIALHLDSPNIRNEMFCIDPNILDGIYNPLSSIYNILAKDESFSLQGNEITRAADRLYLKLIDTDELIKSINSVGYEAKIEKNEKPNITDRDQP